MKFIVKYINCNYHALFLSINQKINQKQKNKKMFANAFNTLKRSRDSSGGIETEDNDRKKFLLSMNDNPNENEVCDLCLSLLFLSYSYYFSRKIEELFM